MRVLIADDSVLILERLQQMLCSCEEVELIGSYLNGNDAYQAISTTSPDLAIIDIKMPGMNGFDVVSHIRESNKAITVIILTFYATEIYRQRANEVGADYFFSKVDGLEQIISVIDEMKYEITDQK